MMKKTNGSSRTNPHNRNVTGTSGLWPGLEAEGGRLGVTLCRLRDEAHTGTRRLARIEAAVNVTDAGK